VDTSDEYRNKAKFCQEQSRRAKSEFDKAEWLRLAESWLQLIWPPAKRTAEESFNTEEQAKGHGSGKVRLFPLTD
jgi:hypothetical protein